MVPSDESSMPVFEEAVNELIIFKTLKSNPEDVTSLIRCSPGFVLAVIEILTDLLEQIQSMPPDEKINRQVH